MPDQATLEQERAAEKAAESSQYEAESAERLEQANAAQLYDAAARAWSGIGETCLERGRRARSELDRLDYACRAAAAWWRVAQNYGRIFALTGKAADATAAAREYGIAADLLEKCASRHFERAEFIDAAARYEQAQACYERAGAGPAAGRCGRARDEALRRAGN